MAETKKRIIQFNATETFSNDDYLLIDGQTNGTRKILASNVGGSGGGVNYSTTEQDTGLKWIDGKTIYQKTFIITQNDTWEDLTNLNIDNCIEQKGTFNSTSGACLAFNVNPGDSYYGIIDMELINNRFRVYVAGWTLATARVTLRYTKTTDTV